MRVQSHETPYSSTGHDATGTRMKTTQIWKIGDCLQLLPEIPDKSIDMILTDLPYGTTQNKWDSVIPLSLLWIEYKRIIKDDGAIVLTAQTPFDKVLGYSAIDILRYEWIWIKKQGTGHLNSSRMPLKDHENILVFYKSLPVYNPQKVPTRKRIQQRNGELSKCTNYGAHLEVKKSEYNSKCPCTTLYFNSDIGVHPTQKPLALFEYLIKTYTNEGDMVHDSCLGSGTTLEACANLNRNCIGFELLHYWEEHYRKRLKLDNTKLDAWTT